MNIAQALADARTQGRKLNDYPGHAPASEADAFAVQCDAARLTGWKQTGWKIGCTSKMAQDMLRADGPFPGPVYAERTFPDDGDVPVSPSAIRLVEPEIAFTMARDLPAGATDHSVEDVLGAAASVHLSLELVNRRLPGGLEDGNMWNIADGGCNDAFVLGPANDVLPASKYAALELNVTRNDQPATTGVGANALGGPDIALTWLANYLNAGGLMLKAGDVITTGVVTGLVYVDPGDEIISTCAELGEVSARYK
ncbi:fumarylacetoacetate hydrolase family protein [Anderseniella sp. Alg231-50]|uniref:fumarylacetoacetate hydrolase family protein n=1 Tax=Anderseniella sp. Alg231-50 TaxID=1922226 RepID=UPI000D55302D